MEVVQCGLVTLTETELRTTVAVPKPRSEGELPFKVERASKAANESKVDAFATGIAMYRMIASSTAHQDPDG